MQSDLDNVAYWLCSFRLCLNVIKSNSMLIGSRQRIAIKTLNVTVGSKELTQVGSVHYLGVTIDPWNLQVSSVVCRVRSRVASLLPSQFGSLSPVIVCALYTAFVLPLYDYCDVVWSPTTSKFTNMLESVHSKFTRKLLSILLLEVVFYVN